MEKFTLLNKYLGLIIYHYQILTRLELQPFCPSISPSEWFVAGRSTVTICFSPLTKDAFCCTWLILEASNNTGWVDFGTVDFWFRHISDLHSFSHKKLVDVIWCVIAFLHPFFSRLARKILRRHPTCRGWSNSLRMGSVSPEEQADFYGITIFGEGCVKHPEFTKHCASSRLLCQRSHRWR